MTIKQPIIIPEMNLKNIIAESREVAQALNEFADDLERIEKKYAEPQASPTGAGSEGGTQHDGTE